MDLLSPAILNWEKMNLTRMGTKVKKVFSDPANICYNDSNPNEKNVVRLFPWHVSQPVSLRLCEHLGGLMPLPSKVS